MKTLEQIAAEITEREQPNKDPAIQRLHFSGVLAGAKEMREMCADLFEPACNCTLQIRSATDSAILTDSILEIIQANIRNLGEGSES